nr:dUTPase [Candidatus Mycoplasma haematolamae]
MELMNNKMNPSSLFLARKMALICEYYEFLNETKLFKYWNDKEINLEKLKEEYIDIVHFTLSLCLIYGLEELADDCKLGISEEEQLSNRYVEARSDEKMRTQLLNIKFDWMEGIFKAIEPQNFSEWLGWIKTMSLFLALTGKEIRERYLLKWELNFRRLGLEPSDVN